MEFVAFVVLGGLLVMAAAAVGAASSVQPRRGAAVVDSAVPEGFELPPMWTVSELPAEPGATYIGGDNG